MLRIIARERLKLLKPLRLLALALVGVAFLTVPLYPGASTSVSAQQDGGQETASERDVVEISNFGGFEFSDESIDFSRFGDISQFGAEPGQVIGPDKFDFGGFFRVFEDPRLFEEAGGDYGDFAAVFGSFDNFGGEFSDFANLGGSFHALGGFFNRSEEALAAFDLAKDLTPEDLEVLGVGLAYDLLDDLDFFGFHQMRAAFVRKLLELTRETRELRDLSFMTAGQWAGVLGSLETQDILGLSDDLLPTALDAMQGRNFLMLPPGDAAALFQATVLDFDENMGQSLADNLEAFGGDTLDLLGATDHGFFFEIGDNIDEIFGSIDFLTLNLESSALSGNDIGVMMAAMGDALRDQDSEKISAAISLLDVSDFGEWTGEVAIRVIDTVGLEQVLGLEQLEGVIGSFESESVGLLGQSLHDIIEAVDFELHSVLLGKFSEGALNTLTPDELIGFGNVENLLNLAISAGAEGIIGVAVNHLDAVLTRVGGDQFGMFDADTFGALTGALPGDILGVYDDGFQDDILNTLRANLFESGGRDFEGMSGGDTSFGFLADAIGTEIVDGQETFSSLLVDGNSVLQQGALDFFIGGLFEDE